MEETKTREEVLWVKSQRSFWEKGTSQGKFMTRSKQLRKEGQDKEICRLIRQKSELRVKFRYKIKKRVLIQNRHSKMLFKPVKLNPRSTTRLFIMSKDRHQILRMKEHKGV